MPNGRGQSNGRGLPSGRSLSKGCSSGRSIENDSIRNVNDGSKNVNHLKEKGAS